MVKNKSVIAFCSLFITSTIAPVFGSVLILVNPTNPAAVTFTSTGSFADLADSGTSVGIGVTFDEIFNVGSPALSSSGLTSSTLRASGPTIPLPTFNAGINNFQGVGTTDYNVYTDGFNDAMAFSTSTAAFTGSAVEDLSSATFKPVGTIGNIFVGDGVTGSGAVIGQYQIIPEPGSLALAGLGALALIVRSRRA